MYKNFFIRNKTKLLVFAILLFMFLVALFSSKGAFGIPGDSGTTDEVAHIPSGYAYDKYQDYRLNPEHPPLAKALAGLPLVLQKNIKGPEADWSWNGINQWEAGWYTIYESGNNPADVLFWARLPMMLLMIVLGLFIFKWAKELYGDKVALLVLLLYAFYPDVIAHGRLVTTDIAAALGFVITIYFFDRALINQTKIDTFWAAVAFALAQSLKFSAFLLFFVLLMMIIIKAILEKSKETKFWKTFWPYFRIYFWTCFISVFLVWLIYIPFSYNTPPEIEHKVIEMNLTTDPATLPLRNFLHMFENNPITLALGHYLLGVILVVARVAGGNATFIMGHLSDKSIPWYFPVAWLLKTPISIIVLFLSSVVYFIFKKKKDKKDAWIASLIFLPFLVYWGFTLKGSLNIGIRHLMPTVPFVLLAIGYLFKPIFDSKKITFLKSASVILILYMIISVMSYYPSFIGYFNESVPRNERHKYLIDSSLDWGQDLLRLKKYVNDNNIKNIKVDYFGGSQPNYYLPESTQWRSSYGPTTGWIAVSATFYQSSKLYGPIENKWSYEWLDNIKPTAIIGGSILVYNIPADYFIKNPPKASYEIKTIEKPKPIEIRKVEL